MSVVGAVAYCCSLCLSVGWYSLVVVRCVLVVVGCCFVWWCVSLLLIGVCWLLMLLGVALLLAVAVRCAVFNVCVLLMFCVVCVVARCWFPLLLDVCCWLSLVVCGCLRLCVGVACCCGYCGCGCLCVRSVVVVCRCVMFVVGGVRRCALALAVRVLLLLLFAVAWRCCRFAVSGNCVSLRAVSWRWLVAVCCQVCVVVC